MLVVLVACLIAVLIFIAGFLTGKAGKDELSKQNAIGIKDAVRQLNTERDANRQRDESFVIAYGALKDIDKGLPAPELIASSAINSISALQYKELN